MNAQFFILLPIAYLLLVSIPILFFDTTQRRVPNQYTLPALWLWLGGSIVYLFLSGEWLWSLVVPIAIAIPVLLLFMVISNNGILGMGDVKLLVLMALTLSYKSLWTWLVIPLVPMLLATIFMVVRYFVFGKNAEIRLAPFAYLVYFVSVIVLFLG